MRADEKADHVYDVYANEFAPSDPRASGYRSVRWFANERAIILNQVRQHVRADALVLDLACGAGLVTRPLRDEGWGVVGLDFNQVACRNAQRLGLEIVRGDAFALPFQDEAFDALLTVEMLQQYSTEEVERLLAECLRVLKVGGWAILVWRNGRSLVHRLASLLLRPVDRSRGIGDLGLQDHSPSSIRGIAARLGFEVISLDAMFPPLRWRVAETRRFVTSLVGSSHLALLRRTEASARPTSRDVPTPAKGARATSPDQP